MKFEQKSEVVQIPIEKWVLVIPLYLKCNSILIAIHLMCWRIAFSAVYDHLRRKPLFYPTPFHESFVNDLCNRGFAAAWGLNIASSQAKL